MVKNHAIKALRISERTDALLKEACAALDFSRPDLVRFLLNHALTDLKAAAVKAKGYDNLLITLRENTG